MSATRDELLDVGRASRSAPSAQLRPTASGRAWRTEFQKASVVWPERVRPRGVGDGAGDHHRQRRPPLARTASSTAKSAALALSVSKMVSTRSRSTPPSTRPRGLLAVGRDAARRSVTLRAPGSLTSGEMRGGAVGRAERAGDEARPAGRRASAASAARARQRARRRR